MHSDFHVVSFYQLMQALTGRFNSHVHVEYEWRLHHVDLDESDDDVDDKIQVGSVFETNVFQPLVMLVGVYKL